MSSNSRDSRRGPPPGLNLNRYSDQRGPETLFDAGTPSPRQFAALPPQHAPQGSSLGASYSGRATPTPTSGGYGPVTGSSSLSVPQPPLLGQSSSGASHTSSTSSATVTPHTSGPPSPAGLPPGAGRPQPHTGGTVIGNRQSTYHAAPTSPATPTTPTNLTYRTPSHIQRDSSGSYAPLLANAEHNDAFVGQNPRDSGVFVPSTATSTAYDPPLRSSIGPGTPSSPAFLLPYDLAMAGSLHKPKHLSSLSMEYPPHAGAPGSPGFPRAHPNPKRRKHPFSDKFEAPDWKALGIHVVLCAITYPVLLGFSMAAEGRTLFTSRVLVGMGCGLMGHLLGKNMLKMGRYIIESATWATLIHQSRVPSDPGIRLSDLDAQCDEPYSTTAALRLWWDRRSYEGARMSHRKFYDTRRWSPYIFFVFFSAVLSAALSFLFGRTVDINVQILHQRQRYEETTVVGTSSPADITRATDLEPIFNNFLLTWTLSPFSSGGMPNTLFFHWGPRHTPVYFAEVTTPQLQSNGTGLGTFETSMALPAIDSATDGSNVDDKKTLSPVGQSNGTTVFSGVEEGAVLRFPRWGIRIQCSKIPLGASNIIPSSPTLNLTYVLTPRNTLRDLFQGFDLPLPEVLEAPVNTTQLIAAGDTLPDGIDFTGVAGGAGFWPNGVALNMHSRVLDLGTNGTGFVTVETVLVRLNSTFAPNGTFAVESQDRIPDQHGNPTFIGFDAAVCVELYEPWVVDVYNSTTGLPTTIGIVAKGNEIRDLDTDEVKEKRVGEPLSVPTDGTVQTKLSSVELRPVYVAAHQNSVNQILKDNGRDSFYVPSPTLISFTSGMGPYGYTELNAEQYAKARGLADAANALPYLAGSGKVLARRYTDQVLTETSIKVLNLAILVGGVFCVGLFSALFVPKLPLDTPRRGFNIFSWMTAFYAHELVATESSGIYKGMDLEDMEKRFGDVKFRYVG